MRLLYMSLSLARWVNMCTAASTAYENSVMFSSIGPYLTLPPLRFISPRCLYSIIANILLFIKEELQSTLKEGEEWSAMSHLQGEDNKLPHARLPAGLMFPDATRVETLDCTFVNRLNQIYVSMVNLLHCFLSQLPCLFRELTHQSILRCCGDIVTCTRCCNCVEDEHQASYSINLIDCSNHTKLENHTQCLNFVT